MGTWEKIDKNLKSLSMNYKIEIGRQGECKNDEIRVER